METNWPWTACPWDSMRDRSPPSSDTMELAKPQLCKIVHMLSTVLPSFAELRVWHLIKDLKVCSAEVLTVFLCFLLVSDQGQSWQGCFHPPLAQPTFSAKTFVLNSAQSGRIWVYALNTMYFSACTYALLGDRLLWKLSVFCALAVKWTVACCNAGWQSRNTSGSTPAWRVFQRRRWRRKWNKLWMMLDCLTNESLAQAPCPVSLNLIYFSGQVVQRDFLFNASTESLSLTFISWCLFRWDAEEAVSGLGFCWWFKGCDSGWTHSWCWSLRTQGHLGSLAQIQTR